MFKAGTLIAFVCVTFPQMQAKSEQFKNWEVDTPPGFDPFEALHATEALTVSDLHATEYMPKLSVLCERRAIGPYGRARTNYKALKIEMQWFALHLPKDFDTLETFLATGVDARAASPRCNSVWVNFGRAWTASAAFSDLITVDRDNSSPIETVKITGLQKGFQFSAEILDSNEAESFLKAWIAGEQIPVTLQDAKGNDLSRVVNIKGMKPTADKVLSYCGRDPDLPLSISSTES